jgi:hypothetical protein
MIGMTVTYLALVETAKRRFFRTTAPVQRPQRRRHGYRILRRAGRFTVTGRPARRTAATPGSFASAAGGAQRRP